MKFRLTVFALVIILFSGCSGDYITVYMKVDSADGWTEKTQVKINELAIGQVEKVSLEPDFDVVLEVKIDNEASIPKDSKFIIFSADIFGTKRINLIPGTGNDFIANHDTIYSISEDNFGSGSISAKIYGLIEGITGVQNQDSILVELRRLNENLENLERHIVVEY